MTDVRYDIYGDTEAVTDIAAITLKESFAALFRSWEGAVERSQENPEHVHQLRVSTRRVAAAIEMFEDWLPRRKSQRMLDKLDEVRKSAGSARDCDVFAARIAEGADDEAVRHLQEHLKSHRTTAQQTLVSLYEETDHGEKLERRALDLIGDLRPRGRRAKQLPNQFGDWALRQLRKGIRKFFESADVDATHLERLHEFRIQAKQFRYYLELLKATLEPQRFKKAYSGLKKLTQRLGEINDHATAIETLTHWIDSQFDAHSVLTLRQWRKEERRLLRRAVADFTEWWTSQRRRQLRRKFKQLAKSTMAATAAA